MSTSVILVAAGSGTRLGASVPKAFAELVGEPIVEHALRGIRSVAGITQVVVVVPERFVTEMRERCASGPGGPGPWVDVVAGGAERTHSVAAGLAVLDPDSTVVLVHDAARCLTPTSVFERVIAAVERGVEHGVAGAIPGLPVVDTIKVVDEGGVIIATPDRRGLRAVQTPQGFDRATLVAAYASGVVATDDAALVESTGHDVVVVEGDPLAFKITTREDLERAARALTV